MLRNYTSGTPVANSLAFIERRLADFGASMILKEYNADKRLSGLCFMLPIEGRQVPFKLPSRVEAVAVILRRKSLRPRPGSEARIAEQAERTAWKSMAEWVDLQLTMISLGQVKLFEVLLPFLYDPSTKNTYYERLEQTGFKGLLPAPEKTGEPVK